MSKKKSQVTEDEIWEYDNVPVGVAADYLGKTPGFIQAAIKSQRTPFGVGTMMPGGKWSFQISPGMLIAYKKGGMIVHIRNSYELI